jgi:tripartite-type tricarboxylate transporter receptor subunit TctC
MKPGPISRRSATLLLLASPFAARSQPAAYPSGPVRIIVPVLPGGTVDIISRAVAAKLSGALGQPFVVDNRTGGAGVPATLAAVRAVPDGYTLYMGTIGTVGVNPLLMKNPPYDPQRDLLPISLVGDVPGVLVVNPSVPANTVTELIQYAKQHPGQLNFGSPGNGSSPHMAAELFKQRAGVDIVHVPYAGASQALVGLMGGQIQMFFDNLITSLPYIKSGKLKALGVTAAQRSRFLPDLPSISESGLPGYEVTGWLGLMAPVGTPPAIVQRLATEVQKLAPGLRSQIVGAEPIASTPDEFKAFIKAENERWATVIKTAKLAQE